MNFSFYSPVCVDACVSFYADQSKTKCKYLKSFLKKNKKNQKKNQRTSNFLPVQLQNVTALNAKNKIYYLIKKKKNTGKNNLPIFQKIQTIIDRLAHRGKLTCRCCTTLAVGMSDF